MIIGSGSASFEMLRYLVGVLPVMVTPKWIATRCQPIALSDVVDLSMRDHSRGDPPLDPPRLVARRRHLRRDDGDGREGRRTPATLVDPGPAPDPRLSSHFVDLVTPLPVALVQELIESLVNEVVVTQHSASEALQTVPMTLEEAIGRTPADAGDRLRPFVDADLVVFRRGATDPEWADGTVPADVRSMPPKSSADELFSALTRIGGDTGWYAVAPSTASSSPASSVASSRTLSETSGKREGDEVRVHQLSKKRPGPWYIVRIKSGRVLRRSPGETVRAGRRS